MKRADVRLLTIFSSAVFFLLTSSDAGALPFQESFEDPPGSGYTLNTAFDDGFFDFFDRYAVPDTTNAVRDDFQTGFDGEFAIFRQGNNGEGGPATVSVDITGIDISGETGLNVSIALGALNSEPDFNNYEAVDNDGIDIFATIDGGTAELIGSFKPNDTGASDLYQDTTGNGEGDGTRLTVDLTEFVFPVSGTGNLMDISIELTSTSGFEPLAVDNVQVFIPEPSSFLLMVFGTMLLLIRRK